MKMIRSYQQFCEPEEKKSKNKGAGMKGMSNLSSIDYAEYIANKIEGKQGTSATGSLCGGESGSSAFPEQKIGTETPNGEFLGNSRIDGDAIYKKDGVIYNHPKINQPWQGGVFQDGVFCDNNGNMSIDSSWHNGTWNSEQTKPHDGFGDWAKGNITRELRPFEKWMIGIGIGGLITGIVTIIIMIV